MKKIVIPIVVISIILIYFSYIKFSPVMNVDVGGYLFTSNQIVENLLQENQKDKIEYEKVKVNDVIYQQRDDLFVGETKKVKINASLPLLSSDGSTLYNFTENGYLIDYRFQKTKSYANSVLANGELYNQLSLERADNDIYYFLELENNVFINLNSISITDHQYTYNIPVHSFIYFDENEIRYYYLKNDKFRYERIDGVDADSEVSILKQNFSYEQLRILLELLSNQKEKEELVQDVIDTPNEDTNNGDIKEDNGGVSNEPSGITYVKPEVSVSHFKSNIYSMTSTLNINDPAFRIKKSPTFEIKINNSIYLRKSIGASGDFEITGLLPNTEYTIVGSFTYLNEEDVQIKKTFFEQTISTKDISGVEPLIFSLDNTQTFPHHLFIQNMKLDNDSDDEVLKGLKTVKILLNDSEYTLSSSQVSYLKQLKSIDYETPKSLDSNSKYTYQIVAEDVAGNSLKIKKDAFNAITSKEEPQVSIDVLKTDLTTATVEFTVDNKDNVSFSNLYYIVVNRDGKTVAKGDVVNNKDTLISDLDVNEVYQIQVYGDYDLENGNGVVKNQKLSTSKFSTQPISVLGYVRLEFEDEQTTQDSANYHLKLNSDVTDSRLVELLDSIEITLTDSVSGNEVLTKVIDGDDITLLQSGDTVDLTFSNLTSNSVYDVNVVTYIRQGNKSYELKALTNLKEAKTFKKQAFVSVINEFSNENLIDFDAKVVDDDLAIESDFVRLEVRDSHGSLVYFDQLEINGDYQRFTLDKLNKEEQYTFSYIVEEYNIGYNNTTFEENKIIYQDTIVTNVGIYGELELDSLLRQTTSKNVFDINNESRWKTSGSSSTFQKETDSKNNSFTLSAKNSSAYYAYFLPECNGQTVRVSFYAKHTKKSNQQKVYFNGAATGTQKLLSNLSTEYQYYEFEVTISNSYFSFNVNEISNNNTTTTVSIKDLQVIPKTSSNTNMTKYDAYTEKNKYLGTIYASIYDSKQELMNNNYYVRILEENELVDTLEYTMSEAHQSVDDLITYEFNRNINYELQLCVKIRDRLYPISSLYFSTESEIRTIKTTNDFFAMHVNGKYLVANDLDFRNVNRTYGDAFSGTVDFQGHQVLLNIQGRPSALMSNVSSDGVLRNLDIHYYLDNPSAKSTYYGLVTYQYGTIENLKMTIEESTNVANSTFSLLCYANYGTISNFVFYSKAPLSGSYWVTLGCLHQYGVMTNGYAYGEPINATFYNATTGRKRIGVLAGYSGSNAKISNIYSLIGITVSNGENEEANNINVGNLIGEVNRVIAQKVYTYVEDDTRDYSLDPSFGYVSYASTSNVYYASDFIYQGKYSNKISKLALRDDEFQDKMLNSDNQFDIDSLVPYGYYPQLIWPDSMPTQDYISLPTIEDDDLIDVTTVDKVEQEGNKARVVLTVSNPGNERITNISLKDISSRIISQETEDNKTKLTIEVSNPTRYVSRYYIKSISSVGEFNIPYTREYEDNERALEIDMYRMVSSVSDWKKIKQSLTENYMLTTDLDFKNETGFQITGTFSGKLNGDGHTIKNIRIESGDGMFSTVTGTISNLYVEDYVEVVRGSYGGFISYASSNSVVDNVHLKNVNVSGSSYIGGLIGYANSSMVSNSSVTNFKVNNVQDTVDIRVGGLIGYSVSTIISHCYAQDVDLELEDPNVVYAAGGLIGELSSGTLDSAYATGSIHTSFQEAGGITGRNGGYISNVYTNVDIYSQQDFLGGIAGFSSNSYISNTLVVGEIYSYYQDTTNTHRTIGNVAATKSNYVWSEQKMNGLVTSDVNGDILVTTDELNTLGIYSLKIDIGDYFDDSNIGDNSLPFLYNSSHSELLPNQKKSKLKTASFEVKNITLSSSVSSANILLEIDNPEQYEIKEISIDGLNITNIRRNVNQDGLTYLEVVAVPEKYYDSYMLEEIVYVDDGKEKICSKSTKIALQFFKDIENFEDWQSIGKNSLENYRLVADIDFSGQKNVNSNISVNRLEGTDGGHTLSNIDLTFTSANQALINTVSASISNINFDNITISNTATSGNYTGIVRFTMGEINNLKFNHITINAPKVSYSAPIANDRSISVRNISLNDITVSGSSYVAGFIARTRNFDMTYLDFSDVSVSGTGNYISGLIGYRDYSSRSTIFHITGQDITVKGGSYVGSVFGYGGADQVSVSNVTISGGNYVGGINGISVVDNIYDNTVTDSYISSTGDYLGGITGYTRNLYRSFLIGSTVEGTSTNSSYLGGIAGGDGYTVNSCGVIDSTLTSLGDSVGGIRGRVSSGAATNNFVRNTNITGAIYVGGVVGRTINGTNTVANNLVNASVSATNHGAGGLIGYVNNLNTTSASNISRAYTNIVESSIVEAPYEAGGLIGIVDTDLYDGHFYNNLMVADVSTVRLDNSNGLVIGSGDSYANNINNLRVYENSTLNGTAIKDSLTGLNKNGILVTADDLTKQATYTSIGLSTGTFDYAPLSSNSYPVLKNVANQEYISLPVVQTFSLFSMRSRAMRGEEVHVLPEVYVYASGIDTINVEFSSIDSKTNFTIHDVTRQISQRTYTFSYNFIDEFTLTLSDGINEEKFEFSAEDLAQTSITIGQNYYYLKDGKIKTNDTKIDGSDFVHFYGDQALKKDGSIYSISEKEDIANYIEMFSEVDVVPMYRFYFDNYTISTFANYSYVDTKLIDKQVLVKNEKVELIDSSYENVKNMVVMDSYNNEDYLMVLGTDGVLHSLKSEISYPSGFKNRDIKSISSNIMNSSNLIFVEYEDGNFVCFDYKTGTVYSEEEENKESLLSYFQYRLSSSVSKVRTPSNNQYEQAEELVDKLEDTSISEVLSGDTESKEENDNLNHNYLTVYEPVRGEYVVYDLSTYFSPVTSEEQNDASILDMPIVDDQISINPRLEDFYYSDSTHTNRIAWVLIFSGILTFIVSSFVLLKHFLKRQSARKV